MSYEKQEWVDAVLDEKGAVTNASIAKITAEKLNHMEEGIADDSAVTELSKELEALNGKLPIYIYSKTLGTNNTVTLSMADPTSSNHPLIIMFNEGNNFTYRYVAYMANSRCAIASYTAMPTYSADENGWTLQTGRYSTYIILSSCELDIEESYVEY